MQIPIICMAHGRYVDGKVKDSFIEFYQGMLSDASDPKLSIVIT